MNEEALEPKLGAELLARAMAGTLGARAPPF
jgi:hypothetical protein